MQTINITQLLSLYLTFCSNSEEFANVRCSNLFNATIPDEDSKNFRICKLESTRNYLTRNVLITNGKVSDIDANTCNAECIDANLNYLRQIHNLVKDQYYGGLTNVIPLWTTIEWLSGAPFLTKDHSHIDINAIKSKNITIGVENMSLSTAYHVIFPWILNIEVIMIFHDTIFKYLIETMDKYVFQHAGIINLYLLKQMENQNNVLQNEFEFIRNSIKWYGPVKKYFNEYLYLPYLEITRNSNETARVISYLENMDREKYKHFGVLIPGNVEKDVKKMLDEITNHFVESRIDPENYHKMLLTMNCNHAIDFVSSFFSIVKESMRIVIEFDKQKIKTEYCHSVFKVEYNVDSIQQSKGRTNVNSIEHRGTKCFKSMSSLIRNLESRP